MESLSILWQQALANPVPLFATSSVDPRLVLFDIKGFYLSAEAEAVYRLVKNHPHLYAARLDSNDCIYFGKSNQPGGRWRRSRYYHLRDLALEFQSGSRRPGGRHTTWPPAWFEPFENQREGMDFVVRSRLPIVISFYLPKPPWSNAQLLEAESALIAEGRRRGLTILNVKS